MQRIINRAKALLEADCSFFAGPKGHRRLLNGRIVEATDKPSYELFAEKALIRQSDSAITVTEAFHRYFQFCKSFGFSPLTRSEFRSMISSVIREEFQLGLRKDVPGSNGRAQDGWIGIGSRPTDELAFSTS